MNFRISDLLVEILPISIARKLEAKKNDKRRKMNEVADKMDDLCLNDTLELITRSKYITLSCIRYTVKKLLTHHIFP